MILPFTRMLHNYVVGRQVAASLKMVGWCFSSFRAAMIPAELSNWQIFYQPINLEGKTVLDVGAGEGETAKFFLERGAARVVCVEPDVESYRNLLKNSLRFKGIVAVNDRFRVGMIWQFKPDFVKVDIEGYEECLLGVRLPCPAVVEVHGLQLRDRFQAAGYKIKYSDEYSRRGFGCFCYAYWGVT